MSDSRPAAEIQTTTTSEHTNSNRVSRDPNTNTDSLISSLPPLLPFPSLPSFPAATALGYAIPDGMKRERGLEREQDIPDKMPLCKSRMHGESTRWSAVTVWETRAWTRKKKNGEAYPHILAPRNLLKPKWAAQNILRALPRAASPFAVCCQGKRSPYGCRAGPLAQKQVLPGAGISGRRVVGWWKKSVRTRRRGPSCATFPLRVPTFPHLCPILVRHDFPFC